MRRPLVLLALLPALVIAIALTLAVRSAAAAQSTAYFSVSLTAAQDLTWTEGATYAVCDGGTVDYKGSGRTTIRVHTKRTQPAMAVRYGGRRPPTLTFAHGKVLLPVEGTVRREGQRGPVAVRQGNGRACGNPLPPQASDCGTRAYPADAKVGVEYLTQDQWNFGDPAPLVPSLVLLGPNSPGWVSGTIFQTCPGVNGDELLGYSSEEGTPIHSGAKPLRLDVLFGHARRFTVHWQMTNLAKNPIVSAVSGERVVTTTTSWSLTFKRLPRRPSGL
jgi:hypothetical protein